ncbi:MAG: hypothetical protein SGCHY_003056, partial [Lobulomycetales sp.]
MAAAKINWSGLLSKLKPDTLAAVNTFRRRHADVAKQLEELRVLDAKPLDFAAYSATLSATNKGVVSAAEEAWSKFKPAKVNVTEQLAAIELREKEAVKAAEATEAKVKQELIDLNQMLTNIETARPLEHLHVDDVAKIMPEVDQRTAELAHRGQWIVPGYYEKFGE